MPHFHYFLINYDYTNPGLFLKLPKISTTLNLLYKGKQIHLVFPPL